jgi:hypothetical protein
MFYKENTTWDEVIHRQNALGLNNEKNIQLLAAGYRRTKPASVQLPETKRRQRHQRGRIQERPG